MPGEVQTMAETTDGATTVASAVRNAQGPGWSLAVVVQQIMPGVRQRSIAAVHIVDPLDSFTDAGIVRMIPGLADEPSPHVEAIRRQREKLLRSRLDRTIAVIKGVQS
jgi:hypothetical protein